MHIIQQCDFVVAASCFVIATQIVCCATSISVTNPTKVQACLVSSSWTFCPLAGLIVSFIALSGTMHMFNGLLALYPENDSVRASCVVLSIFCVVSSVLTAIACWFFLPVVIWAVTSRVRTGPSNEPNAFDIANMLKESIVTIDSDARITSGNEASCALFGNGFLGQYLPSVVHADDRKMVEATLQRIFDDVLNMSITVEYRIKGTDQSVTIGTFLTSEHIWVESTLLKSPSSRGQYGTSSGDVTIITRSIDERKRSAHYRKYHQMAKEKEAINEAKLRYISCVAHDLKTPLQSFCFTVDLLANSDLAPEQRELLEQTNVAVDLMKLTISQTMDISKALKGAALQPRRRPLLLSSVIQRVSIIINGYGKQVPVTFEVSPIICDTIITDEEWLWQMLLNLLTNACKSTDRGEIHVKVSLSHETKKNSEKTVPFAGMRGSARTATSVTATEFASPTSPRQLLFEVIDTGVGIREEKLESIFEAFAQVQTGQVTGTGLGLFGVRRRAEGLQGACGARHNLQSSTGTGTVIWFSIPYVIDHAESLASNSQDHAQPAGLAIVRAKPGANAASPGASATLLIQIRERGLVAMVVDDAPTIRKLMERTLLQLGFEKVIAYENGSKALNAMMEGQVDIVFTDVQMPIMTGPEMARRFRAFEADALARGARTQPQMIVAVSANNAADGLSYDGFDFVCSKPLCRTELYSILYQYLGQVQGV